MRLAEHVERTTDVDGMLDRMTPEQFDEWCAKDKIEPIGHATRCLGLIAHLLWNTVSSEEVAPEVCMPWMKYDKTPDHDNAKGRQMLAAILGGANRGNSG